MNKNHQSPIYVRICMLLLFSLCACKNGPEISFIDKQESSNLSENTTNNGYNLPEEANQKEATCCFDMFVNVCDPALNNEHFVGKGSVKVFNIKGDSLLWEDKDGFDEGKIATICFAYDPDDAYYIEIILNNSFLNRPVKYAGIIPVSELLKYHVLPQWDTSMNALHIQLCPGKDDCFFGQYICNTTK